VYISAFEDSIIIKIPMNFEKFSYLTIFTLVSLFYLQDKDKRLEAEAEAAKRREEEEIAEYKRKMEPRKRKPRKQRPEVEEMSFLQKYGKFIVAPMLGILLSVFVYYLFNIT
jgi:biotin carboxyl carrier protein